MCGRLYQTLPLTRLLKIANAKTCLNPQSCNSSYNVCPTTYIPIIKPSKLYLQTYKQIKAQPITQVKQQQPQPQPLPQASNIFSSQQQLQKQQNKQLEFMPWGHKSHFNFIVNGRIQQMLNKKTFLNFIQNRCVVIMQGYYQWNQKKQPFSFRPKNADHFLVAALYTDNKQVIILTKDATPELSAIHHRMPVILSHEEVNVWLHPKNTKILNDVINKSLLKKEKQIWKNVGCAKLAPYVSSVKEKSSKCLMTIEEYKKELDKTGLMKFWKKAPVVQAMDKNGEVVKVEGTGKMKEQINHVQNIKQKSQMQPQNQVKRLRRFDIGKDINKDKEPFKQNQK